MVRLPEGLHCSILPKRWITPLSQSLTGSTVQRAVQLLLIGGVVSVVLGSMIALGATTTLANDAGTGSSRVATSTLSVSVRDDGGNVVADYPVKIVDGGGRTVFTGTTDDDGQLSVDLPQGQQYTVIVDGQQQSINLNKDRQLGFTTPLQQAPEDDEDQDDGDGTDNDSDGAVDEDDEPNSDPADGNNEDDDNDGAIDEDDEGDGNNVDDDSDGAIDEDDEPDSDNGDGDANDNDGDGAVDEDDEADTSDEVPAKTRVEPVFS